MPQNNNLNLEIPWVIFTRSEHPLFWSVTDDGLNIKTYLTLKMVLWNWHIIYPSHQHELPLYWNVQVYKSTFKQLFSFHQYSGSSL